MGAGKVKTQGANYKLLACDSATHKDKKNCLISLRKRGASRKIHAPVNAASTFVKCLISGFKVNE